MKSRAAKVQQDVKKNLQAKLKNANIVNSCDKAAKTSQTDNQSIHKDSDNKNKTDVTANLKKTSC